MRINPFKRRGCPGPQACRRVLRSAGPARGLGAEPPPPTITLRLVADTSAASRLAKLASDATHLAADLCGQIEAALHVLQAAADDGESPAGTAYQILADALASARPTTPEASYPLKV